MLRPLSAALQSWQHHPSQKQWQQWQAIQKLWPTVVGSQVSRHTQPHHTQGTTLNVATSSTAWAQNLRLQRRLILDKLNPLLAHPLTEIHFSTHDWLATNPDDGIPRPLHPPAPRPPSPPTPPPPTPQAAFQRWAHRVKTQQRDYHPCPRCQSPTPNQELDRWGTCTFCHHSTQGDRPTSSSHPIRELL